MSGDNGVAHPVTVFDPPWLVSDISLSIVPPLINTASNRNERELEAVIEQFHVNTAERYRKRDIDGNGRLDTFCNIFVSDVTAALCAPIPHRLNAEWQNVAANARWLRSGRNGWMEASAEFAQDRADLGHPSVAVYDPISGNGHIAILRPSRGRPGVWIAQAGGINFLSGRLEQGFGKYTPHVRFYTHQ
jgi:hypothetical protein